MIYLNQLVYCSQPFSSITLDPASFFFCSVHFDFDSIRKYIFLRYLKSHMNRMIYNFIININDLILNYYYLRFDKIKVDCIYNKTDYCY